MRFCIGNADTEVFLMKETLASEKRAALLYLTLNRLEKTGKLKSRCTGFFKGWKADRCCQGRDSLYDEKVVLGRECDMKKGTGTPACR